MLTRRKFQVLLALGLILSIFGVAQSAGAQSQPPSGICNGVVNQLEQRGTVEENLIRAAARKNAEVIQELNNELNTLKNERQTLEGEIAAAEAEIAEKRDEIAVAEARILQIDARIVEIERQIQLGGCQTAA